MTAPVNRQWLLARRPGGPLTAEDLRWVEDAPVPEPSEGEILVKNLYLSCDPTQRKWLATDTYLPAVRLGEVVRSFAAGEVVASRHARFRRGQLVQGLFGWQDYAAVPVATGEITSIPEGVPVETAMSVLGHTGLTAYFGLLEIGRPRPGETVVVSAAAGATGSVAGQIARIEGCRAIGIAGGPRKCGYLTGELGFDAAIDHQSENVVRRLRECCPEGIDVFFDGVGGRVLEAGLLHLALRARVVLCGAIATYNDRQPAAARNYLSLIVRRARMEGFVVLDHMARADEAIAALSGWIREGKLRTRVDVVRGLENAPAALDRLFTGENLGKQLVKVAEPG